MRNLLILGAGGHGHVVAETARSIKKWLDYDRTKDKRI